MINPGLIFVQKGFLVGFFFGGGGGGDYIQRGLLLDGIFHFKMDNWS